MTRFVLYRILGNDLPPRHASGQTRFNLQFILRNEPPLPDCEKRWVVNRIVDPAAEKAILGLLEKHHQPVLHLPFVDGEYAACDLDFENLPETHYFLHDDFRALTPAWKLRVREWCYRNRTVYLTNINAARNAAIAEGRGIAEWILPFDGNCFFTESAWREFRKAAAGAGERRYLVVPLARVRENRQLLDPSFRPEAAEEPQIVFRKDAAERFDASLRYGTMDKSSLLTRLGVPGIWDKYSPKFPPWEKLDLSPSPDLGKYETAGWVARLFSGQEQLERESQSRDVKRMRSILSMCNKAAARGLRRGYSRRALRFFSEQELEALRAATGVDERRELEALKRHSARLLKSKPPREEGWGRFARDVTALALCGWINRDAPCMKGAAARIRTRLLGSARTSPWKTDAAGDIGPRLVDLAGFVHVLDAIRLVELAGVLPTAERARLRQCLTDLLGWLDTTAMRAAFMPNHIGTAHDLSSVAVGLYLGRVGFARLRLDAARMRFAMQILPDGSQPHEPTHRSRLFNLDLWAKLLRLAPAVQLDPRSFATRDGREPETAAAALLAELPDIAGLRPADRARVETVRGLIEPGEAGPARIFMRSVGAGRVTAARRGH